MSAPPDNFEASRSEKLQAIAALGIDPWGQRFDGHQPIAKILSLPTDVPDDQRPRVRIAGRIVSRREGGKVHYTDGSQKNAKEARGYFEQARVADRIEVHVGDALDFLAGRKEQFDIVFCDVDKHDYPRAASLAAARVRKGGLFITDNTLWKGKLAYMAGNPELKPDPADASTNAIAELNRLLGTNLAPEHGPLRAGDIRHSRADITLARRHLGYEPTVSFADGLEQTLRWYRDQAAGGMK